MSTRTNKYVDAFLAQDAPCTTVTEARSLHTKDKEKKGHRQYYQYSTHACLAVDEYIADFGTREECAGKRSGKE